jgi:2,3-diketo-5-methylthio-1-phosphopentane phosphatase
MSQKSFNLFVDFDGTVTERDVGDGIFTRFMRKQPAEDGLHERLIDEWKAGRISSVECLTEECAQMIVTEKEFQSELDSYTLTPGFAETAGYCRDNGIPMTILSDGLDYYIKYLLEKNGLGHIPYFSNHMSFANGGAVIEFPHLDKGCGRCGNCKRAHMKALSGDSDIVVYIGDGYSDRFAIKDADVIFARADLAEYCRKHNHEFLPYTDFYSILAYLENGNDTA